MTEKGVRVMSDFFDRPVVLGDALRFDHDEYQRFWKFAYMNAPKYGGVSEGLRRDPLPNDGLFLDDPAVTNDHVKKMAEAVRGHLVFDSPPGYAFGDVGFNVFSCRYRSSPIPTGSLWKATKTQEAPRNSGKICIATQAFYRHGDKNEGGTFLVSDAPASLSSLDGSWTSDAHIEWFGYDSPGWVYCVTQDADRDYWTERGKRTLTRLRAPVDHFAKSLGHSFGVYARDHYGIAAGDVVNVMHGLVRYMDPVERSKYLTELTRCRNTEKSTKADFRCVYEHVFTKDDSFQAEQEYRFFVQGGGPSLTDEPILLPVEPLLMDCYE